MSLFTKAEAEIKVVASTLEGKYKNLLKDLYVYYLNGATETDKLKAIIETLDAHFIKTTEADLKKVHNITDDAQILFAKRVLFFSQLENLVKQDVAVVQHGSTITIPVTTV